MPVCPKCGHKEIAPSRIFSVMVEPAKGERGMTERNVGMYTCSRCGTKFPTIMSKQKYLIVAEEQLRQFQGELKTVKKDNEDLRSKVQSMSKEQEELQSSIEKLKEEHEIRQLRAKLNELESYVEHLRKEKGELERRASKFR